MEELERTIKEAKTNMGRQPANHKNSPKRGQRPQLYYFLQTYISLASCMEKLLERIITERLVYILESRNLLNDNEAGFRPNRCTTDQV